MSRDADLDAPLDDQAKALTVPLAYLPWKCAEVLELDMGDGVILYNHDSSLVHHLNPSASIVWQLFDGEATVGQLGREIAEEYGLELEETQQQVATLVAEFDALGLVEDRRNLLSGPASRSPRS